MVLNYTITDIILKELKTSVEEYSIIIGDILNCRPVPSMQFLKTLREKGIVKTFEMQSEVVAAKDPHVQIYLQIIQGTFGLNNRIFTSEDIWHVVEYMELCADKFIEKCERKVNNEKIN